MDIMGKRRLIHSLTLSEEVRKPAKQINTMSAWDLSALYHLNLYLRPNRKESVTVNGTSDRGWEVRQQNQTSNLR